jgi:hypothetical protein
MNFRELLELLERRVGAHQIPLNPRATGLKDLFEGIPLHNELVRKLARAIFEANGCRQLTDPVAREATLNAIGPIRSAALNAASADVDVYRLLDELCVAIAQAFTDDSTVPPAGTPAGPRSAEIIPLDPFRRKPRIKAS